MKILAEKFSDKNSFCLVQSESAVRGARSVQGLHTVIDFGGETYANVFLLLFLVLRRRFPFVFLRFEAPFSRVFKGGRAGFSVRKFTEKPYEATP